MNEKYKNWAITKGDYQKETDNPEKYFHGYKTKKKLGKITKLIFGVGAALVVLAIIIAAMSH